MDALLLAEIGGTAASSTATVTDRLIEERKTAQQRAQQPATLFDHGGDRKGGAVVQPVVNRSIEYGSTNADYLTARIARDRPDILDRMKSRDYLSVRAASRVSLRAVRPYTTPADARYL